VSGRGIAVAAALLIAAFAAAGCGLGAGADIGPVGLNVTREFGSEKVLTKTVGAKESDTVMRVLEGSAEIETRYGGGYVKSIEGLTETNRGGDPYDWFFFVDGVESPVGAAEYPLRGNERIWWDYRDWKETDHVPAVVGSWPAPFVAGYEGERHPVYVDCRLEPGARDACYTVEEALEGEGVKLARRATGAAIQVLVGSWPALRGDRAAAQLEGGPKKSGVYARFEGIGSRPKLVGLDADGEVARRFGPDVGLVAATRRLEEPPVWVVTGSSDDGVQAAAELLNADDLRDHYAVAVEPGEETPLPVR
jgi:hypothetical protein